MIKPRPYIIREGTVKVVPFECPENWEQLSPNDARGIIWLFEEPNTLGTYIIGADPPGLGIPGWSRHLMTDEDVQTDNATCSVWRIGKDKEYQAAEFAGPIDVYDHAKYLNALGRLYGGDNDLKQALIIIEGYPARGGEVVRSLIHDYKYTNIWVPYDQSVINGPDDYGWRPDPKSVRDLSRFVRKHTKSGNPIIRSPWLISEMEDCILDPDKLTIYAEGTGIHDDRLRGAALAWYAARGYDSFVPSPRATTEVYDDKPRDWQRMNVSYEDMMKDWNGWGSDDGGVW